MVVQELQIQLHDVSCIYRMMMIYYYLLFIIYLLFIYLFIYYLLFIYYYLLFIYYYLQDDVGCWFSSFSVHDHLSFHERLGVL